VVVEAVVEVVFGFAVDVNVVDVDRNVHVNYQDVH
jgi:hypothetical protein